ncbi:MAG: hypothetical protein JXQ30_16750 [Spirochaetes bacterium]|nr:hypothetical protein [Spirochaetota bacterium]
MEFLNEEKYGDVIVLAGEDGHHYGRVVGGIGWKGKRPGFIVAVGEDLEPDRTLNAFHRWILGEYEGEDTLKLLEKVLEYRTSAKVKPWLADTDNKIEMGFLEQVNMNISYRDKLYIERAPNCDDPKAFQFCLSTVEASLNPQKVLHFKESKIHEYMGEINTDNRDSLNVTDYPAIVALGNALAYMREHTVNPYENLDSDDDEERNARYDYLNGRPE